MSFGGAVSAMITSLKNNKRSRVSTFKKLENYKNTTYKKGVKEEKTATPKQLKEIRYKLQKQNKKNLIFNIAFTLTLLVILYILFNFARF